MCVLGEDRGAVPHYRLVGLKVLTLCSVFSDTTLMRDVEKPCYSLARVEIKALRSAFTGVSVGGVTVFPWGLAGAEWLLSKGFLSCQAAPFLVRWLQRAGFSWHFPLCT